MFQLFSSSKVKRVSSTTITLNIRFYTWIWNGSTKLDTFEGTVLLNTKINNKRKKHYTVFFSWNNEQKRKIKHNQLPMKILPLSCLFIVFYPFFRFYYHPVKHDLGLKIQILKLSLPFPVHFFVFFLLIFTFNSCYEQELM